MKINLNDESDFTLENVKKLIASVDDSNHRQLRVTKDGFAFISNEVGNENIDNLACRFETWCMGNSYVGLNASQDDNYIKRVYKDLQENWPSPKSSYIDY